MTKLNDKKVAEINAEIETLTYKGKISDGSHTFYDLYYHRMVLFSIICNRFSDIAWKSKQHEDGSMYPGYFVVGINTPEGQFSYHYPLNYWDNFMVTELHTAPEWDGHQPEDVDRLFSLLHDN